MLLCVCHNILKCGLTYSTLHRHANTADVHAHVIFRGFRVPLIIMNRWRLRCHFRAQPSPNFSLLTVLKWESTGLLVSSIPLLVWSAQVTNQVLLCGMLHTPPTPNPGPSGWIRTVQFPDYHPRPEHVACDQDRDWRPGTSKTHYKETQFQSPCKWETDSPLSLKGLFVSR